jgi:hypothetical protein
MATTYSDPGCPVCGGRTTIETTKWTTGALQYAACCQRHGRVQKNWYTTTAKAQAAGTCHPSKKTKNSAPV